MTATDPRVARVPRRRSETRKRLLAATRELLLERGSAAVTVDSVTGRAGYTRGAFYSNFASIDALIFGLYADHMDEVLGRLSDSSGEREGEQHASIEAAIAAVIAKIPFDLEWLRIRINFAAQSLHDPELEARFLEQEEHFKRLLEPVLLQALARLGLQPRIPIADFTRAVIAAHNGALANSTTDTDPKHLQVLVCTAVVVALTEHAPPEAGVLD